MMRGLSLSGRSLGRPTPMCRLQIGSVPSRSLSPSTETHSRVGSSLNGRCARAWSLAYWIFLSASLVLKKSANISFAGLQPITLGWLRSRWIKPCTRHRIRVRTHGVSTEILDHSIVGPDVAPRADERAKGMSKVSPELDA